MKIAIIGYSGGGKSTLASKLADAYNIPKLHLDQLQFLPDWQSRLQSEVAQDVKIFLDNHPEWVIDGNYSFAHYDRRMAEADQIIFLNFNRIQSLWRAVKRYQTFKGRVRDSSAPGCPEQLDWEFIYWILWKGRSRRAKQRYQELIEKYPKKVIVLKNQTDIDLFLEKLG
ncbi:DNA topology modulation protein [Streptococcus moroccensis]|uniref:Adenylate kinase family enzyme n=1 Tax=Streptococcus moroccensis TaxID=1451356 RepID=A0ABT9YT62_9STRE|nr:DNA topology modulation protein [Streptococcus moroccensis]MDQ0223165.1 adenylate kinase family enzyme [Streptococcus moroccensis]